MIEMLNKLISFVPIMDLSRDAWKITTKGWY